MMFPQPVGFRATVSNPGLTGLLTMLLLFFPLAPPGRAATVIFAATDLTDTSPGQDLWEYSYQVTGVTFAAGQGFTIFFDRALFAQLQSPPPFVNADWDPLTIQPDLALNSDGFYDAQALRNNPSLADLFRVSFVRRSTATPGSQPYAIYDANFSTISQGQTTNVPEPTSLALFVAAASLLARRLRKAVPGFNPSPRTKAG